MSEPTNEPPAGDALQFDHVEHATPTAGAITCVACHRPITDAYFEANAKIVCPACRANVDSMLTGGSGAVRFFRAAGAGLGAAVVGAGIYYAIRALTGYELGLVAIVVGFLVGGAVRWGANRRGGWLYQALAMVLTYAAIVSTYIPPIIQGMRENRAEIRSSAGATNAVETVSTTGSSASDDPIEAVRKPTKPSVKKEQSFAGYLVAGVVLLVIACAAPFLAGFENIIGLLIIGFGLYQAWKLNRRVEFQINGPYRLGARPPLPPSAS